MRTEDVLLVSISRGHGGGVSGGGVGDGEIKGDVKNYLALDLRESKVTGKACVSCVV